MMTYYQKLVEAAHKAENRYPNDYLLMSMKSLRVIARAKSLTNRKFVKRARQADGIIFSGRNTPSQ